MKRVTRTFTSLALVASMLTAVPFVAASADPGADAPEALPTESPTATNWLFYKRYLDQTTACDGGGLLISGQPYVTRSDCMFAYVAMSGVSGSEQFEVQFREPGAATAFALGEGVDWSSADGELYFTFAPDAQWPAGRVIVDVHVDGESAGTFGIFHNWLGADVDASFSSDGAPGDAIEVAGTIAQYDVTSDLAGAQTTAVPATYVVSMRDANGTELHRSDPRTAGEDGAFSYTVPGSATLGLAPDAGTSEGVAIDVVDTSFDDDQGHWASALAGSAALSVINPATLPSVTASFVSSTGWVKPGDQFPFRVLVANPTEDALSGASVSVAAPHGVTYVSATPLQGPDPAIAPDGKTITWGIGSVPAGAEYTLVVQAQSADLDQDPELVWKDLSSTATLRADGLSPDLISRTHGPKVIPPTGGFETARYGDKPFPMVPVAYQDRAPAPANSSAELDTIVNDPGFEGSTFNLYQEMSFGQLYPFGTVPSAGIASATFGDAGFEHKDGFDFTERDPGQGTCRGATFGDADDASQAMFDSPLYPQRIQNGWYVLPGDTQYYGGDWPSDASTAYAAVLAGVRAGSIDSACGPIGKAVYDAAHIADPEIDYNDFDSDKDGVVDFFMMVFVGCGGNGASQLSTLGCPAPYGDGTPYDNIWPHSSSLESYYVDGNGQRGYVSDDQLRSLTGTPQCWVDDDRLVKDDCAADGGTGDDNLPVLVRVGPYNVNPETVFEAASVISHEYGHHLGLPDFYASWASYGHWNLMAADYSQHLTIFSKQELGWVVPEFVQPGQQVAVADWEEIKNDTGEIHWITQDGVPYTLSEANEDQNIHNSQAYGLKLDSGVIISEEQVAAEASGSHVWWSGRGNDFGCQPVGAHNLDILLPELADVADGASVELRFKSSWDIEWDWDYGFVLATTDGETYASLPSLNTWSTPSAFNPNNSGCLDEHDNGLTGTSGAWAAGPAEATAARNPAANDYSHGAPFLQDAYDLSAYAGAENVVVRLSYATDEAFDRPGWFTDDFELVVDGEVVWSSDSEDDGLGRFVPGGCGDVRTAEVCTDGWMRVQAGAEAPIDHGYYLELRDRSGFDFDGRGQADRGSTFSWSPGVLIEYTNELRGLGNNGLSQPPAQQYLDSRPVPGQDCNGRAPSACDDAAFTTAAGDDYFSDLLFDARRPLVGGVPDGEGWVDNFEDLNSAYGDDFWHLDFGCLTMSVDGMSNPSDSRALPSDLSADATIAAEDGCRVYDYGIAGLPSGPTAAIAYRPASPEVGQSVTFDGSGSTDLQDAPDALTYAWDLDDDGTFETSGQTATTSFDATGEHTVRLKVADTDGLEDVASVIVTVVEAALSVTSVDPGCVVGGDTIAITGAGFGATQGSSYPVLAGEQLTDVVSWSATEVVVTVPADHPDGYAGIVVDGQVSNGKSVSVVDADDPGATGLHLDRITPDGGQAGTQVTFTGTGFGDVLGCGEAVAFNGQFVPEDDVVSWSDTEVVALAPEGVTNGYAGIVTNGESSNGIYYYATEPAHVDDVSPDPVAGGAELTIVGTGFGATQGDSYPVLAGEELTDVVSWSDAEVVVTVPGGQASGYAGVVVDGTASNGVFVTVDNGDVPTLRFIDPTEGAVGDRITFDGENFGDGTGPDDRVVFRDGSGAPLAAPVVSWSDGTIVVEVPAGAASGYVGVVRNGNVSNGKYFTLISP